MYAERKLAANIIEKLEHEFASQFHVECVMYEEQPLLATHLDQPPIPKTHACDVVVFIIWSRLGELLPVDHFTGSLSGRPVTGTEYEFEEALLAARANDAPRLLLYKKTQDARVSETDRAIRKRQLQQLDRADAFIDRWFGDAQSTPIKAALHLFETPERFAEMLEKHLRAILTQFLHVENFAADAEEPNTATRPRAAISYVLGRYDAKVMGLADRLNREGIDCVVDRYDDAPTEGMLQWMLDTMVTRVVLVVCTAEYGLRVSGKPYARVNRGIAREGEVIKWRIYAEQNNNGGILPIVFDSADIRNIPELI